LGFITSGEFLDELSDYRYFQERHRPTDIVCSLLSLAKSIYFVTSKDRSCSTALLNV